MEIKELLRFIIERIKDGRLNYSLEAGGSYDVATTHLRAGEWSYRIKVVAYRADQTGEIRRIDVTITDRHEGSHIVLLRVSPCDPGRFTDDDELRDLVMELKRAAFSNANGIVNEDRIEDLVSALSVAS